MELRYGNTGINEQQNSIISCSKKSKLILQFFNVSYLYKKRRLQHAFQHSGTFPRNTFHVEHGTVYSKNNPLLVLGDEKKVLNNFVELINTDHHSFANRVFKEKCGEQTTFGDGNSAVNLYALQ